MAARGRDIYQLTQMVQKYLNADVRDNVMSHVQGAMERTQQALARSRDDAVRIERQRRRLERKRLWASRWAVTWAILCVFLIVYVAMAFSGMVGDGADAMMIASGVAGVTATGALSIRSARRMVLLRRAAERFDEQHRPAVTAAVRPPLPPKGSAAYEPMQRLSEAEDALTQLVRQLSGTQGTPASVPLESVEEAERAAAEAALALRAVAAQLTAVELARDHAPPMERAPLIDGVRRLREQLDEGLTGYRGLLAAAGRVVAASSSAGPKQELADATDRLAGLAVALRELSQ
ncbi:phage shock envelope stress response protein PspM [Actinophytocola sp.]|uniref:phage shock envelope stress response protein PspM n=1 Tax=Actinophytocola sp. TaxID=1872138 RepID=UPI00389AFD66